MPMINLMCVKAEPKYNGESEKSGKNAQSSSSSSTASNICHGSKLKYLPPDLWASIIINLPVKTLLRFRCVCKSWCSIIDHPDFAYTNLKVCKIDSNETKIVALESLGEYGTKGSALTIRQGKTLEETAHIFKSTDSYDLIGRCNELLLLNRYVHYPNFKTEMRLWNPSIRKSLLIPTCPLVDAKCLLGFSPRCKDYKIVAMLSKQSKIHVAVYTLREKTWSVRNNCLDVISSYVELMFTARFYKQKAAFYFQGAVYWFGMDLRGSHLAVYTLSRQNYLVSFNFDSERFTLLEIPQETKEASRSYLRFLFILGESLAIFSITKKRSGIWVLEQGSGKGVWTNWFSGHSTSHAYKFFRLSYSCSPLSPLLYYESDGDSCFFFGKNSYNIATGLVTELGKSRYNFLDLGMYMESLLLWKGYGAEDMASVP
ncbi:F-box/kelch-repeat protein At3g23880-like [Silene latifolia]|uniref:F-box/kelch-repeat protein At3g23880-like n=1 Tax=Silene latifolia TaxID=37657 RepID=UPI003D77E6DF